MTMCAARFVCPLLLTAIGAACQAPEAADPRAFDASTADASVTGSSWPSVNLWASASTGAGFVIAYTTQSPSPGQDTEITLGTSSPKLVRVGRLPPNVAPT